MFPNGMPGQGNGNWNQASRAAFQQQSPQGLMPHIFGDYQGLSNLNFQHQMPSQQPYMSSAGMGSLPGNMQNMNSFNTASGSMGAGSHLSMTGMMERQRSKVRVKCESCGVLLEVNVPQHQSDPSMVVRCGNCQCLLEVQLKPQAANQPNLQINQGGQQLQIPQMLPNNGNGFNLSNMGVQGQMNRAPFQMQPRDHQHAVGSYNRNPMYDSSSNAMNMYMMQNTNSAMQNFGNGASFQGYDNLQQRLKSTNQYGNQARRIQEADKTNNKGGKGGRKGKRKSEMPNAKPRQPSLYNKFVSKEVERLKKTEPGLNNKEMFRKAAAAWKYAPSNPKRIKVSTKEEAPPPKSQPKKETEDVTADVKSEEKAKEFEKFLSLDIGCKEDSVQLTVTCCENGLVS